jgi:uncharacterized membrane protein YbhN (UPF0104 family)
MGRRGFPWFVAIATVGYVFIRVPLPEAWSAAREARVEVFVPLVLAAVLFWFLLESYAYARLFSRFNTKLSWREARSLRGLSYLLTPIHLSLGKVGIVLRLAALKKISPLEATSTVALYQMVDAMVLAALSTIGLTIIPTTAFTNEARALAIGLILSIASYLIFIRFDWPRFALADRVRRWTFHRTHRRVGARDLLLVLGIKLAYQLTVVAVFYFGARAFGVELPFSIALATTPIILAIGAIPISPAGLGTQQASMLYFFSSYGSDGAIVAFGFTLTAALVGARCLLGLFYLPTLSLRDDERSEPGTVRARRFARPYYREEAVSTSSGPGFP